MNRRFLKQTAKIVAVLATALAIAAGLSSCEEEDDNKVAKAQECLNNATAGTAQNCIDMVNGIESEAAYTIRCSSRFLIGGLDTARIVNAFKEFDEATTDKEKVLIENLSLTGGGAVAAADAAYADCAKTGVPGLMYIASLTRVGTLLGGGTPGNIQGAITTCSADASAPGCEPEKIAESVLTLADIYCVGDSKDEQICKDIAAAQAASGGNSQALVEYLLSQID